MNDLSRFSMLLTLLMTELKIRTTTIPVANVNNEGGNKGSLLHPSVTIAANIDREAIFCLFICKTSFFIDDH
jgi:hypothetical protein